MKDGKWEEIIQYVVCTSSAVMVREYNLMQKKGENIITYTNRTIKINLLKWVWVILALAPVFSANLEFNLYK